MSQRAKKAARTGLARPIEAKGFALLRPHMLPPGLATRCREQNLDANERLEQPGSLLTIPRQYASDLNALARRSSRLAIVAERIRNRGSSPSAMSNHRRGAVRATGCARSGPARRPPLRICHGCSTDSSKASAIACSSVKARPSCQAWSKPAASPGAARAASTRRS